MSEHKEQHSTSQTVDQEEDGFFIFAEGPDPSSSSSFSSLDSPDSPVLEEKIESYREKEAREEIERWIQFRIKAKTPAASSNPASHSPSSSSSSSNLSDSTLTSSSSSLSSSTSSSNFFTQPQPAESKIIQLNPFQERAYELLKGKGLTREHLKDQGWFNSHNHVKAFYFLCCIPWQPPYETIDSCLTIPQLLEYLKAEDSREHAIAYWAEHYDGELDKTTAISERDRMMITFRNILSVLKNQHGGEEFAEFDKQNNTDKMERWLLAHPELLRPLKSLLSVPSYYPYHTYDEARATKYGEYLNVMQRMASQIAFLSGLHRRLGQDSSLKVLGGNKLYEPRLLKEILELAKMDNPSTSKGPGVK